MVPDQVGNHVAGAIPSSNNDNLAAQFRTPLLIVCRGATDPLGCINRCEMVLIKSHLLDMLGTVMSKSRVILCHDVKVAELRRVVKIAAEIHSRSSGWAGAHTGSC